MAKADKQNLFLTTIQSCYPMDGDWFYVWQQHCDNEWLMSRVILWALTTCEGSKFPHVEGIESEGGPCGWGWDVRAAYYVKGTDLSPSGKSWNDIYRETQVSCMDEMRTITNFVTAPDRKR